MLTDRMKEEATTVAVVLSFMIARYDMDEQLAGIFVDFVGEEAGRILSSGESENSNG